SQSTSSACLASSKAKAAARLRATKLPPQRGFTGATRVTKLRPGMRPVRRVRSCRNASACARRLSLRWIRRRSSRALAGRRGPLSAGAVAIGWTPGWGVAPDEGSWMESSDCMSEGQLLHDEYPGVERGDHGDRERAHRGAEPLAPAVDGGAVGR